MRVESESRPISEEVVTEIADRLETDPTRLQPPLYEAVDLEALNAIFADSGDSEGLDGHVEFEYKSYRVRVESDGSITLDSEDRE